jgi:DNA-directed RNA polymerase specialized sigma subunit
MERIGLKRLEALHDQLEILQDKREAFKELLVNVPAIDYEKAKVQTSIFQDPAFAKVAAELSDIEAQIARLTVEYITAKAEIIERLYRLPKRQRDVLFKRYVEFKSLTQVAGEMVLSYAHIRRLHQQALYNFYAN